MQEKMEEEEEEEEKEDDDEASKRQARAGHTLCINVFLITSRGGERREMMLGKSEMMNT
jgi:hypothetical protein